MNRQVLGGSGQYRGNGWSSMSDIYITVSVAIREGYALPQEGSSLTKNCEFCGAGREMIGMIHPLKPKEVLRWQYYAPCTCDGYRQHELEIAEQFEKEQEENQRKAMMEEDRRQREIFANQIKKLLGESGIKRRFLTRTFGRFAVTKDNEQAYKVSQKYVRNWYEKKEKGQGLYFYGDCGTGKTHLAAAISLELIKKQVPVIFKTDIDLLSELKKTFDGNGDATEHEILELYRQADLLVIDDLGKQNPTNWALPILSNIINDRYEDMRPVIVTTNYSDSELIARLSKYGDFKTAKSLVSRLHGMCMGVEVSGEDYRSKGGAVG